MFGMYSKGTESRPEPHLFILAKHTKNGRVVSKTSQGTGSVDSTASGLTMILLRENLFSRQWDVIEIGEDMVDIYLAGNRDIAELGHKVSNGHACSWRDL